MILLIDNYDSFTFNLVHLLGDLGARCDVVRNDQLSVDEALGRRPAAGRPLARPMRAGRRRDLP